jgi:hypothetical protein
LANAVNYRAGAASLLLRKTHYLAPNGDIILAFVTDNKYIFTGNIPAARTGAAGRLTGPTFRATFAPFALSRTALGAAPAAWGGRQDKTFYTLFTRDRQ